MQVFIQYLRDAGIQKLHQTPLVRLQLLEVGALRPDNYAPCSKWIEVTPIDLHARVPGIIEQDFLTMDDVENVQRWHAISLSLVLNFVPDAHDRGEWFLVIFFVNPQTQTVQVACSTSVVNFSNRAATCL